MNQVWNIDDAIKNFYDLINSVLSHQIQIIELKNQQKVLLISMEDFEKTIKPKNTLVDFFKQSPLFDMPIELERNKEFGREFVI